MQNILPFSCFSSKFKHPNLVFFTWKECIGSYYFCANSRLFDCFLYSPPHPVLVTSNFDDDLVKNEWASMETPFSHYKSMGNFLDRKGSFLHSQWFDLAKIRTRLRSFCMSSLPASIKRIESKTTEKRWLHPFPHYKSMGAFCCHGNQSFDPICSNTLCSLPPTPIMLYIKFDQDWPTGFRDIQVQKCEIFVIQGQVTPKWVAWFGPKLNSTKLLCLFWLPATLMMIWSKMNKLAWRHHFPIISLF